MVSLVVREIENHAGLQSGRRREPPGHVVQTYIRASGVGRRNQGRDVIRARGRVDRHGLVADELEPIRDIRRSDPLEHLCRNGVRADIVHAGLERDGGICGLELGDGKADGRPSNLNDRTERSLRVRVGVLLPTDKRREVPVKIGDHGEDWVPRSIERPVRVEPENGVEATLICTCLAAPCQTSASIVAAEGIDGGQAQKRRDEESAADRRHWNE